MELPDIDGKTQFSKAQRSRLCVMWDSTWWAFNHLSTLAAQRWGDIRKDLDAKWNPMQREMLNTQAETESKALELFKKNPEKARKFLTDYSMKWAEKSVQKARKLGDFLWTKYDEKF